MSVWLHGLWSSLGLSVLLQKAWFFFVAEYYSTAVSMYHFSLSIPLWMDTHCFHAPAAVKTAAVNLGMYVSFWICVFAFRRYLPRSGITGSYSGLIFRFFSEEAPFSWNPYLYMDPWYMFLLMKYKRHILIAVNLKVVSIWTCYSLVLCAS